MIKLAQEYEKLKKSKKNKSKKDTQKNVKTKNKGFSLKKILYYGLGGFIVIVLILYVFARGEVHKKRNDLNNSNNAKQIKYPKYPPKLKVTQKDLYMEKAKQLAEKEKVIKMNQSSVNDFNEGIDAKKMIAKKHITKQTAKTVKKALFKTEYFCKNLTPIDNEIIYFVKLNNKFIPVYSLDNWDGRGIKFKKFEIKKALKKVDFKNHEFYEIEKGKFILNDKKRF